jgi:hypothetical protein
MNTIYAMIKPTALNISALTSKICTDKAFSGGVDTLVINLLTIIEGFNQQLARCGPTSCTDQDRPLPQCHQNHCLVHCRPAALVAASLVESTCRPAVGSTVAATMCVPEGSAGKHRCFS